MRRMSRAVRKRAQSVGRSQCSSTTTTRSGGSVALPTCSVPAGSAGPGRAAAAAGRRRSTLDLRMDARSYAARPPGEPHRGGAETRRVLTRPPAPSQTDRPETS
eukprot:scaffold116685_cov63-Phaeocystis_antarctica.AAC.2